jgi:hypothetical protein
VRAPSEHWSAGLQHELALPAEYAAVPASNLVWYFAGPETSEAFDPLVPTVHEKGNLVWYLNMTFSRLRGLREGMTGGPSQDGASPVEENPQLSYTLKLLPLFIERAGRFGEIEELCQALTYSLDLLNEFLNGPEFRKRQCQGACTAGEYKILSGAEEVISGIIRRYSNILA